jgi:hypothetical protein
MIGLLSTVRGFFGRVWCGLRMSVLPVWFGIAASRTLYDMTADNCQYRFHGKHENDVSNATAHACNCSMNKLRRDKRIRVLHALVEGNGLRAASRLADVSFNTVLKLFADVRAASRDARSRTKSSAMAPSRPPICQEGTSVVSASIAIHVQVSPAAKNLRPVTRGPKALQPCRVHWY